MQVESEGVRRQVEILVWFRGQCVGRYRADVLVEELVILEMKATRTLEPSHEAQLLNSLKATTIEVGFVLNFGPRPQFKRMAFSNARKSPPLSDASPAPDIA